METSRIRGGGTRPAERCVSRVSDLLGREPHALDARNLSRVGLPRARVVQPAASASSGASVTTTKLGPEARVSKQTEICRTRP